MIPLKVVKISYQPDTRSYAVILKEINGNRCIPVMVGAFEAQSIALAIESVETPRPLTHDLICDVLTNVKSNLQSVLINDLQEGVFFAQLEIESKSLGKKIIDSRPSDAIAIALRMDCKILIYPKIINQAGVAEEDLINKKEDSKKNILSIDALKEKLENAIQEEEYEVAAKLRDKIIELES